MSAEDHANVPVIPPVLFGPALAAGYLLRWLVPVSARPGASRGRGGASPAPRSRSLGLAFGGWALFTFVSAKTTPHPNHPVNALVTWGPYRVSRNPMYVGLSSFTRGSRSSRTRHGFSPCSRSCGSRCAAS